MVYKRFLDWTAFVVMALILTLIATAAQAQCSSAGCAAYPQPQPVRWVFVPAYQPPAYQPPAYPSQVVPATTSVVPTGFQTPEIGQAIQQPAAVQQGHAVAAGGGAAGFLAWLNSTRAGHGLPPVGYDPNLEADALVNSQQQAAMGLGHHFMGRARRQNSAWNAGFPGVESMWMASPGHQSALLDPTIQWIGIAWYGAYCTFSAY